MGEKAKSIVSSMKQKINKAGNSKGSMFFLKSGNKVRVRFLTDMDGANKPAVVKFHSKWQEFNHPCMRYFGKSCPNCKNDDAAHYETYNFTVYNYESKQREILSHKATKASALPALIGLYEAYGTITDRDIVITRNGSGFDTSYTAVGLDKKEFRGKGKVKAFTKKELLKKLFEAFPYEGDEDEFEEEDEFEDDDFEEEKPKKKKTASKSKKKPPVEEDEDDFDDFEDEDNQDDDFDDFDEDDDEDDDVLPF